MDRGHVRFEAEPSWSGAYSSDSRLWGRVLGQVERRLAGALRNPAAYNRRVARLLPVRARTRRIKRRLTWPGGSRPPLTARELRELESAVEQGKRAEPSGGLALVARWRAYEACSYSPRRPDYEAGYLTRPRAATGRTASTRSPLTPTSRSCRFTTTQAWLGRMRTRSPTRKLSPRATATTPCSSESLSRRLARPSGRGRQRQARAAARDRRGARRPAGEGARLHAVPRGGPARRAPRLRLRARGLPESSCHPEGPPSARSRGVRNAGLRTRPDPPAVETSSRPLRRVSRKQLCSRRTLSHRLVGWCGDHVSGLQAPAPGVFRRHRPETTALYEVVRDNLETLYGAIGDGAIAVRIPKHARKELEAYLGCGLLCRGFARLKCEDCGEKRLTRLAPQTNKACSGSSGRAYDGAFAHFRPRMRSVVPRDLGRPELRHDRSTERG
jgi:hypothetical protein